MEISMNNPNESLSDLIDTVQAMDRETCIEHLGRVANPALDFTDEYTASMNLRHLRHVVLAACLQVDRTRQKTANKQECIQ